MISGRKWSPKIQGNAGELSAIEWFTHAGALVWRPLFEHPEVDLIAEWEDGRLERVQVKTSGYRRDGRWEVAVCTRGGNQSWNGLVKRISAERCDSLFVHVGDGRRWYLPAAALGGGNAILLGGPKYEPYEVSSGVSLPSRQAARATAER